MGPLTPIIGLRLLALAAELRHNAEIGQPGLCFSAYDHKFGINHLAVKSRRPETDFPLRGHPTEFDAQFDARFANRADFRSLPSPHCRSELSQSQAINLPNTRILDADRESACSHVAESPDLQEDSNPRHAEGVREDGGSRAASRPHR